MRFRELSRFLQRAQKQRAKASRFRRALCIKEASMFDVEFHEKYGDTLEEAGELLNSYVIPIFCLDKSERPEMEGTGFFLEHNKKLYFITASHVIDAITTAKSKFIIAIHSNMPSLSLSGCKRTVSVENELADNQYDLAVIPISHNFAYYDQCLKLAIPTSKTTLNKSFPKVDMQILQGFPSSKNKTVKCRDNITKHFSGALWTYSLNSAQDCNFSDFKDKVAGTQYPIHWPKKVQGQKIQGKQIQTPGQLGVQPRGCSGGPYWFIPNISKINEYYLAGVFIEYHKKYGIAFVTKIEHVIQLVDQFDA